MAVSIVGATYGTSGASTVASVSVAVHGSAAVGDVALFVASNRGSGSPTMAAPTSGYATTYNISSSNLGSEFGWKRLVAGDLGGTFTASLTLARPMNIACIVLSGAADPTWQNGALVSSGTTHTGPSITPTVDASMLVGLAALGLPIAPLVRTFTPSGDGTWTEDVDICNTTAGTNSAVHISRQLLGAATGGVSHTGVTLTPSDTTTNVVSYRSTFAVAPYSAAATPAGWDELRIFIKS